ncbi:MAG: hypothetical protein ACO1N9_06975 [Flavobacterium sp.]
MPEIIIGSILLFTLLLLVLFYSPGSKAKKLDLLKKYRRTQHLSIKLQDTLSLYILKYDMLDQEFKDGKNYGDYLEYLKQNHQKNLSEGKYLKIRNGGNPILFNKTSKHLDRQKEKLKKMKEPIMGLL